MAYQALLFCPEEKTARTVTQVLSELEFSVEPCSEPFAAVKKLMSQHFDAVVVDCDNEQNATLLFKSARNSTSNQASLAVAIVEGQAGVAKAFRIGANLVLTKPINVEQSKGTLRVARGLLRKGEPVKPTAAVTPTPAASTPVPPPAKPSAPKPVSAVKTHAPVAPPPVTAALSTPIPVVANPAPPTQARTAAARTSPAPQSPIPASKPVAPPAASVPLPTPVAESARETVAAKVPENSPMATPAPAKSAFAAAPEGPVGMLTGGAASAPAPAREPQTPTVETDSPGKEASAERKSHVAEDLFEKPAETSAPDVSASTAASETAPSFTFGGANEPEESTGMGTKILLIAALLLVVVGAYAGWNYFQGRSSPSSGTKSSAVTSTPASTATPVPVSSQPKPSAVSPANSQPENKAATAGVPKETPVLSETESEDSDASSAVSTRAANVPPTVTKSSTSTKPDPEPLVVKGGSVPVARRPMTTSDSAAPSVMGIATPGSNGALSAIAGGNEATPVPVLQSLNISQGVSQGLITKRVQPIYPKAALAMHVEGAVELTATISKAGAISAVKVVKGDPQLSRAAVDAVKQWKYKPYLLNGEPVEIQTQITVNFKLPN
jgi:TonB family protein